MSNAEPDPESLFNDGMALLALANAEDSPRGVRLIDAAADAGYPPAIERCAAFECMGIQRQVNWSRCLDRLRDAAQLGSGNAARQLLLFAHDRCVESLPEEPEYDWQALRDQADANLKLEPAAARTLVARPMILAVEALASKAQCQWLMSAADARLQPAYVQDPLTGRAGVDTARTNRGAAFQIWEMDCVFQLVRTRLSKVIRVPVQCFELPQVLHYAPGQEFKPHHDFLDPQAEGYRQELVRNGQRIGTLLVYLNEDFEGGGTHFPALGLNHRGRTGDALVFANVDPSGRGDPLTLHAGLPPTRGEKWVFSQWVREHPPGMNESRAGR